MQRKEIDAPEETEAESLPSVACVVKICSGASGRNLRSTVPSMQSKCVSVVCIMFHLRFMTPLTYPKVNLILSRSKINAARSESAYISLRLAQLCRVCDIKRQCVAAPEEARVSLSSSASRSTFPAAQTLFTLALCGRRTPD